jgi:hypothetical protein
VGPAEAASVLGISRSRYYALEQRAILGLVSACERGSTGSSADPAKTLSALQRKCARLEQERARYQALARAAQRALGLSAQDQAQLHQKAGRDAGQRGTARALVAAKRLAPDQDEADHAADTGKGA